MEVVKAGRVDLTPLLTHVVSLDEIREGYRIFGERLDVILQLAAALGQLVPKPFDLGFRRDLGLNSPSQGHELLWPMKAFLLIQCA